MIIPPITAHNALDKLPSGVILMRAIQELSKLVDLPEKAVTRTGAVVALAVYELGSEQRGDYLAFNVGDPAPDRLGGYMRNAAEKIARLYRRRREGHLDEYTSAASADSDNPDTEKRTYGGAVVFVSSGYEFYFSISGAHPQIDEAVSYAIGFNAGCPPPDLTNPYLEQAVVLLNMRP